jgi:D-beta-D-heptose 7-phosphate kinase/D-beta-D-heptose 1-phosphate adenosyltransferase
MSRELQGLARYVAKFPEVRVLCVGDIMLDRFVYGDVRRISAEAPIPILSHDHEQTMLGGVGNVARNAAALGARTRIVTVVGDDDAGRELERLVAREADLSASLLALPDRRTTVKVRYIAKGQQVLRADSEDTHPLDEQGVGRLIELFESALPDVDVVLLSDYAKGCLCDAVLRSVIDSARSLGKPVIVDPKCKDLSRYGGASMVKPNARELHEATGIAVTDDESAVAAARKALERTAVDALLVTRAEQGMTLVERDREPRHFKERSREVFDVSGAGDTTLAVVGITVASGATVAEAANLANRACQIVVAKVGTAVVRRTELFQNLRYAEYETAGSKLTRLRPMVEKVREWRERGLKVGFTNGCFDLIHAGHVSLLAQARRNCDRLVVALNSDASVRRLKGEGRPVTDQTARSIVIASLGDVDAVMLFEEDTPIKAIEAVRPDVLIKGADYAEADVVGAEFVKSHGGRVFLAEFVSGFSTTKTIRAKG